MKIRLSIAIILALIFGLTTAQAQDSIRKFKQVIQLPDRTVYIDTTNIKLYENQISAVSLTNYNSPRLISTIKREVSRVKSQVLFNLEGFNYTINGSLYYDKEFRIVGESSAPSLPFGTQSLQAPINRNPEMTALFNKSVDLLKLNDIPKLTVIDTTTQTTQPSEVPADTSSAKPGLENIPEQFRKQPGSDIVTVPSVPGSDTVKAKAFIHLPENKALTGEAAIDTVLYNYNLPESDSAIGPSVINEGGNAQLPAVNNVANNPPEKIDTTASETPDYDFEKEANPKGTIFTDGSKYCYQVSSWRIKDRAEREVERLKAKGLNAFITEAYLQNKGGTWYRVRIGYFDTIEETEASMKNYSR